MKNQIIKQANKKQSTRAYVSVKDYLRIIIAHLSVYQVLLFKQLAEVNAIYLYEIQIVMKYYLKYHHHTNAAFAV